MGYSDALPIHRVAQIPWCVLLLQHVDYCHPAVRAVLAQALADGYLTDGRGRRIYLSDCVVLATAAVAAQPAQRPLGFRLGEDLNRTVDAADAAVEALGDGFVRQADLICAHLADSEKDRKRWLTEHLLADLGNRYRKQGIELHWDESAVQWLLGRQGALANQRDWERLVDEHLSPLLIPYLPAPGSKEVRLVTIRVAGGDVEVVVGSHKEGA